MERYYQVTYKTIKGLEVKQRRDTVERAHYLYNSMINDYIEDGISDYSIKLEEISNNGIALLRAKGEYECKPEVKPEIKPEIKPEVKSNWRPKSIIEELCGMPIEEYNECLDRWNSLTGDNIEHLTL
jgi:hypothetical protein